MSKRHKTKKKVTLSKPAKKEVRSIVKNTINTRTELKYIDVGADAVPPGQTVTLAPKLFQLITVAQGNADTQRIGDEIYLRDLEMRGQIVQPVPGAGLSADNIIRIIIFQWYGRITLPAGEQPAANDLLQDSVNAPANSFINHDKRELFGILYDRVFATSNPYMTSRSIRIRLRKFRHKVKFNQGANTPMENSIWLLITSNSTAAFTPAQMTFRFRMNFTDS